jgi:hypothetical protein
MKLFKKSNGIHYFDDLEGYYLTILETDPRPIHETLYLFLCDLL